MNKQTDGTRYRRVNLFLWYLVPLAVVLAAQVLCPFLYAAIGEETQNKIAATIAPIADIAKHIATSDPTGRRPGGAKTEVITILPTGANPHTFELTPRGVKKLEGVRIVLMIGYGLDDWIKAIGESLPEVKVMTVDHGIDLIGAPDKDPHYWLSITNAKIIAKNICTALIELDPGGKDYYQANLESYLAQLEEVDRNIRRTLSDLPTRKIITFHNGWRYFAQDYGLEVMGNVEPSEGGESTPKGLVHLTQAVSEHQIKALFSEPGVSKGVAESVAEDLGLRLYELDPFGIPNKQSYLDLMMANARVVHEALTHGSR